MILLACGYCNRLGHELDGCCPNCGNRVTRSDHADAWQRRAYSSGERFWPADTPYPDQEQDSVNEEKP